jgi:predicted nucleic acid-binding protein
MIVVDTNVIAALFLPTARSKNAEAALQIDPAWAAPVLWRSEFRNLLSTALRTAGLGLPDALGVMAAAEALMQTREYTVPSETVLSLASESGCTGYDCEFVTLSRLLDVPLVTLDRQILKKFPKVAVSLHQFARG